MTYLVLVSHGDFARGLKNSLGMFAGESMDTVIAFCLEPGESESEFCKRIEKGFEKLPKDSRFIILADIIGGSPLTNVCKVLCNKNKMNDCIIVLGGMNLPMALKALLMKEKGVDDLSVLKENILVEASDGIRELYVNRNDSNEYDI